MAGKRRTVRKGSAARPFLLALAAVAAVFGVGLAVSLLTETPKPAVTARAPVPVPVPPVPVPVPPPAPVATAEPAPVLPYEEPDPPAVEPPPQVAVLPPPPPPPSGAPAPWLKNAVSAPPSAGKPVIAVVIDDMGLDRKRSARTVKLPAPLTLAWLPYAQELREQSRAARGAGHELMLHIPMEPSVQADPGPEALLVRLSRDEIVRRFANALASFDGYVGVNNHMGSRFTADRAAMAPVLAEVQRRGLLWLDSRTSPSTVAATLAGELKLPFAGRDVFLDNVETVSAVRAQLAKAEAVARQHGSAIAIGHPHDATIEALAVWLPEVKKRGFVLVPVSAVVRARCACG
ncbi:divergent polysaccharide deacetylase family protein [Azospirillum sp.]|uniref:divergent polysaccharide deacetylase family protein n=1 Tax=Azospirillum sp. TaxID=34012 RepID=UPI003D715FBF